jgi:hypothetical protein
MVLLGRDQMHTANCRASFELRPDNGEASLSHHPTKTTPEPIVHVDPRPT